MIELDIAKCRSMRPYKTIEYFGRIFWSVGQILFWYSPAPFYNWRALILRVFGAKVGRNVRIHRTVKIYLPWNLSIGDWSCIGDCAFIYSLGPILIGDRVTISQRAHLCAGTHDYRDPGLPLLRLPIKIASNVWICADTFIGPGVSVGEGAIAGAASVVCSDIPAWDIVIGNPAVFLKKRKMD